MRTNCPECGSEALDCVAVDIGVGTQYGPQWCVECGWSEIDDPPEWAIGELTE